MAVGGGSTAMVAIVLMLFLVLPCNMVDAASYIVGDKINGWDFNITNWHMRNIFKEGDELVFTYKPGTHNVVVVVNDIQFELCGHALDSKIYSSGNEKITLAKGWNHFICGFPNHCESGMKLMILVP